MPAVNPTQTLIRRFNRLNSPCGTSDGKWYSIFDDFSLLPPVGAVAAGSNFNFSATGTGTVPALAFATPNQNGLGGVTIATRTASAANNDAARLAVAFTQSAWNTAIQPTTNNEQELIGYVTTPAAITEQAIGFGWKLTDTEVLTTDADQAYFLYDTTATSPAASTTNWVCVNSAANVDLVADSGVAVAVSTTYRFRINIGVDRKARFYINEALVATATTAFANASVNLKTSFFVVSRTSAGAAHSATIRLARRSVYTA